MLNDTAQATAPALLPFANSWELIIYSFLAGALVTLLVVGGVMIVRGSMWTKRDDRDPVSDEGDQLDIAPESLPLYNDSKNLNIPKRPTRVA